MARAFGHGRRTRTGFASSGSRMTSSLVPWQVTSTRSLAGVSATPYGAQPKPRSTGPRTLPRSAWSRRQRVSSFCPAVKTWVASSASVRGYWPTARSWVSLPGGAAKSRRDAARVGIDDEEVAGGGNGERARAGGEGSDGCPGECRAERGRSGETAAHDGGAPPRPGPARDRPHGRHPQAHALLVLPAQGRARSSRAPTAPLALVPPHPPPLYARPTCWRAACCRSSRSR